MSMQRWIQRSIPLAAVIAASASQAALAQWNRNQQSQQNQQELFEWNGAVDREIQIVMRGNQVRTDRLSQSEPGNQRLRTMAALPRQEGQVVVQLESGRGQVDVIQQPTAQNGYSTVIRIRDPRSGSDRYRLAAYWQGYANGEYVGRNNNGRAVGHDKDRDGIDDRAERRDRNGNGVDDRAESNRGIYGNQGNQSNQSLMHWCGNVDSEVEVRIQNGRVDTRTLSGAQATSVRASGGNSAAPRSNAQINVVQHQGRGTVTIVQQPSQWNNYTTVVRIRDPQGGYGYYDFDLTWQ